MTTSQPSPAALVRDLMTVGVPTCPLDTSVVDLAQIFQEKRLEAIVVLDAQGHAAGVISQDDLVGAYTRDDRLSLVAKDVMQEDVPQVPPDIPLVVAAQIMRDQGIRALFMMHHAGGIEYPAAMLTYAHLLRHLSARGQEELEDLGIHARREAPLETFIRKRDAARRRTGKHEQE